MAHKRHCWRKEYSYPDIITVIIFIILWSSSLAQTHQEFDASPMDTEVNPGQIVKLTCRIRNRHGMCYWFKKNFLQDTFKIRPILSPNYVYETSPSNGDCSITISNTSLEKDDGYWHCQVVPNTSDDVLQSTIAKLTVRQAPEDPIIEHGNLQFGNIRYNTGDNFVAQADKESKFTCVSHKGNPPATLKWFIDNTEITANSISKNESESEIPKTFRVRSSLTYTFQREHHGKKLKCVAIHAAYPTGSKDVIVSLNISYIPIVRLEGRPEGDLAEGDHLMMKCIASANPPATVIWKKSGQNSFDYKETIVFNQVKKTDSGDYSCSARNTVGASNEIGFKLDVKYKPNVIKVEPSFLTVLLNETVKFDCLAEGNPTPRFDWLQSIPGHSNVWQHRGSDSTLVIKNSTYSYQGVYVCEVSNIISGKEHKAKSREVELDVVGSPQYLREHNNKEILTVEQDEDAIIAVIFCSDPPPRKIFWEWGSVKLDLENNMGRYMSKPLINEELPKDCYEARLIIQNIKGSDARKYTLNVKNERGATHFDVVLKVKEPVTMSAIIGIVIGCIVVIVIVIIVVFYLLKKERCFIRTHGFHPESENSSQRLSDELHNGRSPSKDRAIPPDALYTDVQAIRHYENPNPDAKRGTDGIVYADLDMLALKSEQPKLSKSHEKIEYAEIQFKPNDKTKTQEEK